MGQTDKPINQLRLDLKKLRQEDHREHWMPTSGLHSALAQYTHAEGLKTQV